MTGSVRLVRAVDGSWMRTTNLSVVLAAILEHGGISRATLARETGLNKATVSSLTEELFDLGWVRAAGQDQGALGRPSELLEPDPMRGVILGVEINVDYLAVLVTDATGTERELLADERDMSALAPEQAMRHLAQLISASLERVGAAPWEILGVGLGVPGVVDDRQELLVAANLGWRNVDVQKALSHALSGVLPPNLPVAVENEANLGAVAELTYGLGAGVDNFVYLSGELGVGAGVVIGGELLRGTHGAAGEVGHVTVDPGGARCQCGKRGCWQVFVSQGAVLDRFREESGGQLLEGSSARPQDILAAAERGEPAAKDTLAVLDRYLAVGVGNLVEMYDPQAVVLGGFYSTMYRDRVDTLRREVAGWVMDAFGRELLIELSTYGQDACVRGAAGAMLRWLITHPRGRPEPLTRDAENLASATTRGQLGGSRVDW